MSGSDVELSGEPGFGEVAVPVRKGDNSNAIIASEVDAPNGPGQRTYTARADFFSSASQRRKAFPHLKA